MFIAMNRFRVAKGSEAAFEQVWISRDSHLEKVPGFLEFHLLKGPEAKSEGFRAGATGRYIWITRNSRASRFDRRSDAARRRKFVSTTMPSIDGMALYRQPPIMLW